MHAGLTARRSRAFNDSMALVEQACRSASGRGRAVPSTCLRRGEGRVDQVNVAVDDEPSRAMTALCVLRFRRSGKHMGRGEGHSLSLT